MKIDLTSVLLGVGIAILLADQKRRTGPLKGVESLPPLADKRGVVSIKPVAALSGFSRPDNMGVGVAGVTSFFYTPQYLHAPSKVWQAVIGPKPFNGYDEIFTPGLFRAINGVV